MNNMTTSVVTMFTRIAPTKKPSSRLKIARHSEHRFLILKGRSTIDALPHAGQRSFRLRRRTGPIGGRFSFINASSIQTGEESGPKGTGSNIVRIARTIVRTTRISAPFILRNGSSRTRKRRRGLPLRPTSEVSGLARMRFLRSSRCPK